MCTTCGCGPGEVTVEGHAHDHDHGHHHAHGHAHGHAHDHGHEHEHDHDHDHEHGAHGDLHYGHGAAHSHAPGMSPPGRPKGESRSAQREGDLMSPPGRPKGESPSAQREGSPMSQEKMVAVERGILDKNDRFARANRRWLAERGVLALNFVSSPGSGKTSLLVETIRRLQGELPLAVIEGDQQTSNDAERIRATGARAIQINTGKGCHLDASMVEHALAHLAPADDSVLFIENVGNLVCPAAFDLGEAAKVVVLSVTEGEDKPLKYPDMFAAAQLMLLNKVDLLPYLDFDVAKAIDCARRVNPAIEVLQVSATRGQGMDGWLDWVRAAAGRARADRTARRAEAARKLALLEEHIATLR